MYTCMLDYHCVVVGMFITNNSNDNNNSFKNTNNNDNR